jgi:hypothetical protein
MLRPIIIIYHTHAQTHFLFHACLLLLRPMLRPIISDHGYREPTNITNNSGSNIIQDTIRHTNNHRC